MVRLALLAICAGLVFAPACGSSSGGGDDDGTNPDGGPGDPLVGLISLTVSPSEVTLYAEGATAATQAFTVTGGFEDGTTRDVTDRVQWIVDDPTLGGMAGATFGTSNERGGRTTVRARAGGVIGLATVTIVIRQRSGDPQVPDLPADPGGPFGGPPDTNRAPTLVYPNDGVLLPPNLGKLEVHYLPGANNQLFAIDFTSGVTDVTVYTRCPNPLNGGCIYRPSADVWRWIAHSNRGDSVGVTVRVRGTDDAGTGVGTSGQIQVGFSQDDIRGGIFYWTTSTTSIMTFDFGTDATEPAAFVDQRMTGYVDPALTDTPEERAALCGVGCHALSRDGKKLVTAVGKGSTDARTLIIDVENRETLSYDTAPKSAFFSWGPNGDQYVGTFGSAASPGYNLNLFDGDTGASAGTIDVGGTNARPLAHPDWSQDGTMIAFTRAGSRSGTSTAQGFRDSSVEMVRRDGDAWSAPIVLSPGQSRFGSCYPAFTPENDLVAFNRAACGPPVDGDADEKLCDCYDDPQTKLFIMRPETGAAPVELARANAPGVMDTRAGRSAVQSSYPKWSPFTFRRTGEFGSRLHWVTFSSARSYGLYTPATLPGGETNTLLWMAAVDPDAALGGTDPSYPAFVLPFQDITTDNHTAQWAERVFPPVD
jgi:hypothetical protein